MTQKPKRLLRVRLVDWWGYTWELYDGRTKVAQSPGEFGWEHKSEAKRNAQRVLDKLLTVGWEFEE